MLIDVRLELLNLTGTHAYTLLLCLSFWAIEISWHWSDDRDITWTVDLLFWPRPATISARGMHIRRVQFFVSTRKTECRKGRHFLKWLWEIHSNANVVLSSAPFDKFATRCKWRPVPTNWFALAIEHPLLQVQEECSLTFELELLNLTGTPWASRAYTLLVCLSFLSNWNLMALVRWPWHHVNRRLSVLTPTSNHFCEGNAHQTRSIFCFYQKDRVSERKAFPEVVVGDTSQRKRFSLAALHLINLPPESNEGPFQPIGLHWPSNTHYCKCRKNAHWRSN